MTSAQNLLRPLSGSRFFIVIAFAFVGLWVNAQEPEVSHFVIHKVKKKETLGKIAKRYDIPVDFIFKYNPKAKDGIKKGDKLRIPRYKQKIVITPPKPTSSTHIVKSKETLWRIAYTYGISIDSLRKLNPKLGDTLSIGTQLQVPLRTAAERAAQFDYYTVLPKEGFYRLTQRLGLSRMELEALNPMLDSIGLQAGMQLRIPKAKIDSLTAAGIIELPKPSLWDSTFVTPVVRLALMAPFRLSKIELDSLKQTEKTLSERNLTTVALDFYAGMLHAIDSLNKVGLSIELTVMDTENQLFVIENLLNKYDFSQFDAVIGPFTPTSVERVARGMSIFNIPVISPLTTREIQTQKTLFNTIPSKKTLRERIQVYIDSLDAVTENPCVLIVADVKNQQAEIALQKQFPLAEVVRPDERFGYVKPDDVDSLLTATRSNFVFLETENLNLITSMTSMLNAQQSTDRPVQLLTYYRSATYDDPNVSQVHLGNLHFTYASHSLEKRDTTRIIFDANYQKRFGMIPSRTSIKGFDVTIDVALRIATKRTLFSGVSQGLGEQLQHRFEYVKLPNGGYQNTATYTIQHKGFETIEVDPPQKQLDTLDVR